MSWLVFFANFIAFAIIINWTIGKLVQRNRRMIRNHPRMPVVNYTKIANLEIELFGETKPNVDSYIKAGLTNAYGISSTGHYDDQNGHARCNVNASIGPVCRSPWHSGRRVQPSPGHGMAEIVNVCERGVPIRDPNGDIAYDDPTWTDEDGRPW